jgi:hypothetical protein
MPLGHPDFFDPFAIAANQGFTYEPRGKNYNKAL